MSAFTGFGRNRVHGARRWVRRATVTLIAACASSVALAAFPDAFNAPPPGWTGPVFRLSQTYPTSLPSLEARSRRKWMDFDFRNPAQAPGYLRAVLNYCIEGNTANDFTSIGTNPVRKWYHAPWLHTTSGGREFIRGMTRERPSRPTELGPLQVDHFDNWAVGFYNARGGYTIGQVWKSETQPDPRKAKFPSHTVTCKLLFTTTPVSQAPFLEGSLEWQADINRSTSPTAARPTLRLLQIDVAVKDPRANPTIGWVFGTFQYEKNASTSANWWDHMVPVGLMWGNDVQRVLANQPSREQWINTARGQTLHLGFRGLLNGPVDNPQSSCSGCHGFAQIARVANPTPRIPAIPQRTASDAVIQRYFPNIKAATAMSPDYVSVDYSLQLQLGISRALASNTVTLPANMNGRFLSTGRPVATRVEGVVRDGEADAE